MSRFTLACCLAISALHRPAAPAEGLQGLTAVAGVKVGHHTLSERPTGCTVVLLDEGAVGGVDVRGSAPGTRETDLLDPVNTVDRVNAIVLAGGSAFGLDAASGVVRYLAERGIGWPTAVRAVPIVPAAILFDLGVGNAPEIYPTADCGYRAAATAGTGPVGEGNVGAGAGATIGKLRGPERAMKSGIGTAAISTADGLVVAALLVVNALGDVVDPATGKLIAGVRDASGQRLADARLLLRAGSMPAGRPGQNQNTTIGVVATNARLSKSQATKIAQMAHDGIARAIVPAHTPSDGDTIFAVATGRLQSETSLLQIGALAAEATANAIIRAVHAATGIPGYPAARDIKP